MHLSDSSNVMIATYCVCIWSNTGPFVPLQITMNVAILQGEIMYVVKKTMKYVVYEPLLFFGSEIYYKYPLLD